MFLKINIKLTMDGIQILRSLKEILIHFRFSHYILQFTDKDNILQAIQHSILTLQLYLIDPSAKVKINIKERILKDLFMMHQAQE